MLDKWDRMVFDAERLEEKKDKVKLMHKTFGALLPYWFLKGVTRPRIPPWCSSRVIPRKPAQVAPSYFAQSHEFSEDPRAIVGDNPGYFQFQPAEARTDHVVAEVLARPDVGSLVTGLRERGTMSFFAYYRIVTKGNRRKMKLQGINRKKDRQIALGDHLNIYRNPGLIPYTAEIIWIDRGHRYVVLQAKEKDLV